MKKNELICLGLIYNKPNYVYAIDSAIKAYKLDAWVNLPRSSIYNTLSKFVKLAYADLEIIKIGNMPDRKVYTITDHGKKVLNQAVLSIIEDVGTTENLFYLSLGFLFDLDKDMLMNSLLIRKSKYQERISDLKESLEMADKKGLHHFVIQAKAGIKHSQVELKIIDEILSVIESNPDYFKEGLKEFYIKSDL